MINNLQPYFNRLPEELIVNCIAPYTYCPQSKKMCSDIQNYYDSLVQMIHDVMEHLATRPDTTPMSFDDLYRFIVNELLCFMNNETLLIEGLHPKIYSIFSRNPQFKSEHHIWCYIYSSMYDLSDVVITNLLWGLLTPEEREQFVKYIHTYEFEE